MNESKEKRIKWMESFNGQNQLQNLPTLGNDFDTIITEYLLQSYGKFDFICDIGTGLGHYINYFKNKVGLPGCKVIGYDVSYDNVMNARQKFDLEIEFQVKNFAIKNDTFIDSSPYKNKLFICRETVKYLWYDLDDFLYNLNLLINRNDLFVLSNNMPTRTKGQYEFDMNHEWGIKDINMLVDKVKQHFNLLRIVIKDEYEVMHPSQGQFVALFRKI